MMQHNICGDFVLATGKCASVRSVAEKAFAAVGVGIMWKVLHYRHSSFMLALICISDSRFPSKLYNDNSTLIYLFELACDGAGIPWEPR